MECERNMGQTSQTKVKLVYKKTVWFQ